MAETSVYISGIIAPQFWAEQLTLSQLGEQIMPTTVLRAPPDFQTLQRPCFVLTKILLCDKIKEKKMLLTYDSLHKCLTFARTILVR